MDIDFRGYTEGDHVDYATFAISHDGDVSHRATKPRIEFGGFNSTTVAVTGPSDTIMKLREAVL